MKKLAVLISNYGTGTNLQAIIDAIENKKLDAQIAVVISDTKDALGLKRARKHKLHVAVSPKKEGLLPILDKFKPDYVVFAGWKQIVTDDVKNSYPKKIL